MVPALAVDPNGTRLGRGAGWYDRALQLKKPRAKVIGICWPWEITDSPLPAESHDIPVDYVLQIDMTTGMNTRILTR